MKKTKPHSNDPCSYCKARGTRTRAAWRSQSLAFTKFACDAHREALAGDERLRGDNGHMFEADHQTWGRL